MSVFVLELMLFFLFRCVTLSFTSLTLVSRYNLEVIVKNLRFVRVNSKINTSEPEVTTGKLKVAIAKFEVLI